MKDAPPLFSNSDLGNLLHATERLSQERVDAVSADQLLSLPEDRVIEHVSAQLRFEPIELHEERQEMEQVEAKVDVSWDQRRVVFPNSGPVLIPAHEVRVSIPFTGNPDLWHMKPNVYKSISPRGDIRTSNGNQGGVLIIKIVQPTDLPMEEIKRKLEQACEEIRFYLRYQKEQLEAYNVGLPGRIRQQIQARKARLEAQKGIQKMLGIPLKRRDDAPSVEPIRLPRQLVRPLPPVPNGGFSPEPGITTEDYEFILSVIRHEGRTFERTPKTYAKHDEEELRDILLAHLNGHYQGQATGETFRRSGKTDIQIEEKNRAAFVTECKMWRGPAELTEGINQLLGYLTWRDCKTAFVIFNKQVSKFSELIDKIPATLSKHPSFLRRGSTAEQGEWRFTLGAPGDETREILIHVFAFNLFV